MVKRSNGNGQSGLAAGDFRPLSTQNNPVAANVTGTPYQLVPYLPGTKTGDVHFKWSSSTAIANIPVITRVWLTASGSTSGNLSNIKFGPPSMVAPSAPTYYVDYAFYNSNMPAQGFVTLEFADPQTGRPAFKCTYDLNSNGSASAPVIDCTPTITTQPSNQSVCGASTAGFSIISSGAASYQWQISTDNGSTFSNISNGSNFSGATSASLTVINPTAYDNSLFRAVLYSTGCSNATSAAALLVAKPKPTALFSGSNSLTGFGTRSLGISLTGNAPWSITYTSNGTPVTVNNIPSSPYYISVSPTAATIYTITSVSDAYCSNSAPSGNVTVAINGIPTVTPTNTNTCTGSSSFSLPYTATGSPDKYSVTSGTRAMAGFTAIANASLSSAPITVAIPSTGVATGTYDFNLAVTNSVVGTMSVSVPFTVTINALPVLSASAGSSFVCVSNSVTLTAAPSNLSSYSWSSNPASAISSVYNPTVTPSATTVYTVTGTNTSGCTAAASVTISVVAGPALSVSPAAPAVCSGNSTVLTASGGNTYSWTPSAGLSATSGSSVIASPVTTTTYTVTSQNSSGCASVGTVTVTVNTSSVSVTSGNATICSGTSSTLTASGASTYSWTPLAGLYTDAAATVAYTGTSAAIVYAKPAATTTYTVQGRTSGGCIATATTTVTVSVAPINTATSTGNSFTFCSQGSGTFPISVNVSSAVTSMTWSYSTTQAGLYTSFTSATSPSGVTFTPSSTASSNATLTGSGYSNGGYGGPRFLRLVIAGSSCAYNYDIQLFDTKGSGPSLPSPTATKSTLCSGETTTLSMGSYSGYTGIQWQSATSLTGTYSNISGATSSTYTTPVLTATTYYKATLAASGNCGYTSGATTITVAAAIASNTISPAYTCTDGLTDITLSGSAITNGIYQWQSSTTSAATGFSDVISATNQNLTLPAALVSNTKWFTRVASTSSCASNTSTAVALYAPITNNQISNSITSFCGTAPATALTGTTPAGGNGIYSYQWFSSSDGTTYVTVNGATSSSYTTTTQTQTEYYKRVVSGGTGVCSLTSNIFVITVNSLPTVSVTAGTTTLCSGTSTTLTASGGVNYTWSPAISISSTTGTSVTVTPAANQIYTVTGTNANGCTNTATSGITVTTSPTAPTLGTSAKTICSSAGTFNLNSLVSTGTGMQWYTAPSAISTYLVSTPDAVSTASNYYAFSKSGSCFSNGSASLALTIADVSAPVVSANSISLCAPATADLTSLQPLAATGTTLEWHTGSTSASSVVSSASSVTSGTYYLFAYSAAGGCYGPASSAVTVTINALPATTVSAGPAAVCYPATINLNNYNNTNNNTYTYQWNTVSGNPTPSTSVSIPADVNATGNYYLYAISSAGCKSQASSALAVTVNSKPTASITSPSVTCAATPVSISSSTNATSPVYAWQISSNSGSSFTAVNNTGIYSGATTGTLGISDGTGLDGYQYKIIITNASGCFATSESATVSIESNGSISTNPSDITVTANNNAVFTISTTGSPTLNYQWKVSTDGGATYSAIADGTRYSGTNSPELIVISPDISSNNYRYKCEISNNCTTAISSTSAKLTVNATAVRPTSVLSGNTTITNGGSATLSVTLTGTGPWNLTYTEGTTPVTVTGITASTYTFSVSPSSTKTYTLTALSDANATAIAADRTGSATVTVNARPTCVLSGSTTITNGGSATLSVALTGTGSWNLTYTDGTTPVTVTGITSSIYTFPVSPSSTKTYTITALSDANATATAADRTGSATVTVNANSAGGIVSSSASACSGSNGGTLTLSGQTGSVVKWQSSVNNGSSWTDIINTTATYVYTNLTITTAFRAVVQSGSSTPAYSSVATIIIVSGQWIGGASGDWNNAANWCGGIPTITSEISIPAGSSVHIQSDNGVVGSLTIAPGANIVMTGDFKLRIAPGGTFTNNGTFDASSSIGAVSFLGTGTISGTTTTFKNIETSGALDFGTSSTIAGTFTIQPGGSVTGHSPAYECPGSKLVYNTGGTFPRNLEWPANTLRSPANVIVQNNTTINFPIAGSGYICNDLEIESGSKLDQNYSGLSAPLTVGHNVTINGILTLGFNTNGNITLAGNWTRNTGGTFNNNGGTVIFNGSSNSIITAPASLNRDIFGAFGGETFYNVEINKSNAINALTLSSNISIINELKLTKGTLDLQNSDVTMVSNAAATAHVAPVPASGASVQYGGTGKFIVQRHLLIGTGSVSRRWRLLTAPLQPSNAPSINQAWQEGVSNPDRNAPINPSPGFGTIITKSATYNATDGYDQGSTENPSLYYCSPTGTWLPLASTKNGAITDQEGYMLFARGNRSIIVSTPVINASTTILEPKGKINIGNILKTLTAGSKVIGNPYASSINFGKATFNNYTIGGLSYNNTIAASSAGVGITYYIFDPKTSGTSGVGKFISCSSNGDGTFAVTGNTSGLATDGTIQSGSAFLIYADNSGGTLTIHETDKLSSSSTIGMASRPVGADNVSALTTNLYAGSGANASIADGVINAYNSTFEGAVNGQDAIKFETFNSKESLSILRNGKFLSVERRNVISENDTIFLNISKMNRIIYALQFIPTNLDPSLNAFLEDKFTGISKAISLTDTTYIPFDVTADTASSAANRFRVVFKSAMILPVTIKNIKAAPHANYISVQWAVDNEQNIKEYQIEKSNDGTNFTKVNTSAAKGAISSDYSWLDINATIGNNYYRIKIINSNGNIEYTKVVKVVQDAPQVKISVYPNPVTDGKIRLQLTNLPAGKYEIRLVNNGGQLISQTNLNYAGGSCVQVIKPNELLSSGNYQLDIHKSHDAHYTVHVLIR